MPEQRVPSRGCLSVPFGFKLDVPALCPGFLTLSSQGSASGDFCPTLGRSPCRQASAPHHRAVDRQGGPQPSVLTADSPVVTPGTACLVDTVTLCQACRVCFSTWAGVCSLVGGGPSAPCRPVPYVTSSDFGSDVTAGLREHTCFPEATSDPNTACHDVLASTAGKVWQLIIFFLSLPKMLNFKKYIHDWPSVFSLRSCPFPSAWNSFIEV